jgi:hypothetical protein
MFPRIFLGSFVNSMQSGCGAKRKKNFTTVSIWSFGYGVSPGGSVSSSKCVTLGSSISWWEVLYYIASWTTAVRVGFWFDLKQVASLLWCLDRRNLITEATFGPVLVFLLNQRYSHKLEDVYSSLLSGLGLSYALVPSALEHYDLSLTREILTRSRTCDRSISVDKAFS